jgi:adenylate kinase family enzyme
MDQPFQLQRVIIIGTSCCGKTTLAKRLAQQLRCPHIELDALYWEPNWVERPTEDFQRLVREAIAIDRWVVDGNYSVVRDLTWPRATHVFWLNYSFSKVLWRALARTFSRSLMKEELYSGNRESLRRALFQRDSILWWVISTYHRRRRAYGHLRESQRYPCLEWREFRKPSETSQLLMSL